MGWIALAVQPFSYVESAVFRQYFKWDSNCQNTLLLYLQRMTRLVEYEISVMLLTGFAVVSDGWLAGRRVMLKCLQHFLRRTQSGMKNVNREHLEWKKGLNIMQKGNLISFGFFSWFLTAIWAKSLRWLMITHLPTAPYKEWLDLFVGCHRHRFSLAIENILEDQQPIIIIIWSLMRDLTFRDCPCC